MRMGNEKREGRGGDGGRDGGRDGGGRGKGEGEKQDLILF